jgi:hypothetical protein
MTIRRAFFVSYSASLRLCIEVFRFKDLSLSWMESLVDATPESDARVPPKACFVACHWACNCWSQGGCGLVGGALRRAWSTTAWLIVPEGNECVCTASDATRVEMPIAGIQERRTRVLEGVVASAQQCLPMVVVKGDQHTFVFLQGLVFDMCKSAEQYVRWKCDKCIVLK